MKLNVFQIPEWRKIDDSLIKYFFIVDDQAIGLGEIDLIGMYQA